MALDTSFSERVATAMSAGIGVDFAVQVGLIPQFHQPMFILLLLGGSGGARLEVRMLVNGFVAAKSKHVQGDRPDQKFTPWIASLASPDLMQPSKGEAWQWEYAVRDANGSETTGSALECDMLLLQDMTASGLVFFDRSFIFILQRGDGGEGPTAVGKPTSTPGSSQVCLASAIALLMAVNWDDREMEAAAPSAGRHAVDFGPVGTPPPDDAKPGWLRDTSIQCGISCVLSEFQTPRQTSTPVFSPARPPRDKDNITPEVRNTEIQTQVSNPSGPHQGHLLMEPGSDFRRSISGPLETVDEGEREETPPTPPTEKAEAKAQLGQATQKPPGAGHSSETEASKPIQPRASSEKRCVKRDLRRDPCLQYSLCGHYFPTSKRNCTVALAKHHQALWLLAGDCRADVQHL
eukprot:symbB.v1.2.006197.t1/scaffold355.1/size243294/7